MRSIVCHGRAKPLASQSLSSTSPVRWRVLPEPPPDPAVSMRMIYSREAARALFVLSNVTSELVPEADEQCASVFGEEEAASREPKLH